MKRRVIQANPGFFVLTQDTDDEGVFVKLKYAEVLAWAIELEISPDRNADTDLWAITVACAYHCFTDSHFIKEPSGRIRSSVGVETEADAIVWFKENA